MEEPAERVDGFCNVESISLMGNIYESLFLLSATGKKGRICYAAISFAEFIIN